MQLVKRFVSSYLYDDSLFRFVYILSLFFSSICFIELPCQIATGIFMAWSIFIISDKFLNNKVYKSIDYAHILILFLISGLITSMIHARDNLLTNFVMMYHVAICFFIFYGSYIEIDKNKIKLEIQNVFKTIVISSTFLSISGLVLAVSCAKFELFGYYLGLRDNRYTGLYTNPNLSAFSSVIALVFCHYLMDKNSLIKWISVSCIISNVIALLLSDSNASMLFIIVYFITFMFYKLYVKDKGKKLVKIIIHSILLLLICAVATVGIFFIRNVAQDIVANFMNSIHNTEFTNETSNATPLDVTDIGRGKDYEVSSGRLDSLNKAMILYSRNPLLGIGKGNIVEYGDKYLTDGFMFTDLHNGYLTVLISTGAIGFLLFMIFSLLSAIKIIKKLSSLDGTNNSFPILFSAIIAYSVFALFERALLFDITFMVVVFWLILGYAMLVE